MRILLDANLGPAVAEFLRGAGHDVTHVADHLPAGSTDPQVAELAISQQRHIVTADRGFSREVELAGVAFPHALVTLRAKNFPDTPGTWLWLLSVLLAAHPQWLEQTHYLVDPDRIRIRPRSH